MDQPQPTITLIEVAPRDGLQNEARPLSVQTRVDLITRAVAAGARRIEAVSFVNPKRVPQMAGAAEVMAGVPRSPEVSYSALVLNRRGLDDALASGVDEVNIVIPCTDQMSLANQGRTAAQMVTEGAEMAAVAQSARVLVTATIAVAFGCPFAGEVELSQVGSAIAGVAGAVDELALADTIGVGVPAQVRALVELADREAPRLPVRFHFHNTRNTGYANAIAAVEAGVSRLDASIGGFGGCPFAPGATGNVATEDLSYLLRRSGRRTGINEPATSDLAAWLGSQLDRRPPALLGGVGPFPPVPTDSEESTA